MNLLYIIFNCIAAFLFSSSIYATMIVRSHNLNLGIGWLLLFFIIGWMLCFIPIYISRNKQHKTFIAILTLLCVGLLSKTGLGTIGWLAMVLWAFFDKSSESMKKTNKQRIEKQNNKVKNCSQSIQKENTIKIWEPSAFGALSNHQISELKRIYIYRKKTKNVEDRTWRGQF